MKQSKRLQEIFRKNREFEKESPYNFCDRWCQRCAAHKQLSCKVYHDEFEQKMTCIAYGRNEDDPEVAAEVMRQQEKEAEGGIEENNELSEVNFDNTDAPELLKIKEHIEFAENNSLDKTAEQYHKKCRAFLENTYFEKKGIMPEFAYGFEVVNWYHALLPVKLHRALCGFHEPACEGDISLYNAVAQLEICKNAISESINALRSIVRKDKSLHRDIRQLLDILHNIFSRIDLMESEI